MLWKMLPAVTKLLGMMPRSSRTVAQTPNSTMDNAASVLSAERGFVFTVGRVVRSDMGWYGVLVHTQDRGDVACLVLGYAGNGVVGANAMQLPIEGTDVLVYLPSSASKYGIVMGVLPPHLTVGLAKGEAAPQTFASMWDLESYASVGSDTAYAQPLADPLVTLKFNANAGRPLDAAPGSWGYQNENGVGIGLTALAAGIRGSSKAQVRVSPIDDQVRVVSGHYLHYSSAGVHHIFNDGGFITEEIGVSPYQCERAGAVRYGAKLFEDQDKATVAAKSLETALHPVKPRISPKKRLQMFTGFLGDLFHMFVANPDPEQDPETAVARSKDQGLAHVHVDSSGRVSVRSAGGISLQRTDRIPVPKRLYEPWDPEGDVVDKPWIVEQKSRFVWNKEHPYGRSLELRDAEAWRVRQAYLRIHGHSQAHGRKDFYLPEEEDLGVPDNNYDRNVNSEEDYSSYDKRQAGIWVEPDGSISIRDAWGSEILMRGGNIVINCPGQAEIKSGKSTVVMGGHDLVLKGRQSVDLMATEKDVRIKADANLHLLAEGRNKGGGILLESKAKGSGSPEGWDETGEAVNSAGIILKAPESTVFVNAGKAHVSGSRGIVMETFDDKGKNEGSIRMSAKDIVGNAESLVGISAGNDAGLYLTPAQAALAGPMAILAAKGTAAVTQGAKAMVPMTWGDTETNVYDQLKDQLTPYAKLLQSQEWLAPYTAAGRDKIHFTYRSSAECGTLSASEVEGGKNFAVYQPFWSYLAAMSASTVPVKTDTWDEPEIDGTRPWPGSEAWDTGYVKLLKELNVTPDTGIAKARSQLRPNGGQLDTVDFGAYEVVKHN